MKRKQHTPNVDPDRIDPPPVVIGGKAPPGTYVEIVSRDGKKYRIDSSGTIRRVRE